jgi:serine/threonine-protein kinase
MSVTRITLLAVPALLLLPRIAHAGEPAAAEQLYDDAKRLIASGNYAEACPKLEQSQKLDPGLGTQFHLADCLQHVGRTASAWALFREVASGANASGQNARARVAKDRADALEPFLSKLAVAPGNASTIAGLVIRRDGTEVPHEAWGSPVPVDPGTHQVSASAPDRQAWQSSVDVEGQGKVVTIEVPLLASVAVAAAPAQVPAPASPSQPTPVPPPQSTARRDIGVTSAMPTSEQPVLQNRGGAQRAVGWVLVGAGLVGFGVGVYFGARWMGDHENATVHCPGGACDSIGIASNDDADKQAKYVLASAGGGLAAVIIGTVLVATSPSPRLVPANTARLDVAPLVGRGTTGLTLNASW